MRSLKYNSTLPIGVFLTCLLWTTGSFSQVPGIQFETGQDLVDILAGDGVQITNISTSGYYKQYGSFSSGTSELGIGNGIFLSTGNGELIDDNGTCQSGEPQVNPGSNYDGSDSDLNLLSGGVSKSKAILEFDITTNGTTLEFDYVFASTEYICYVGTRWNDVFGFFISGGAFSGPYSNSAENVALIGGNPVTINTVNGSTNSRYFVNTFYCGCSQGQNNQFQDYFYGGRTKVMHISIPVECGTTYHLKLAIGNVKDKLMDSGVFLKAGSLKSNFSTSEIVANPNPVCEGQNLNLSIQGQSNWLYEWSTGQSGTGLNSINTTASISANPYSVTVTNPATGCEIIKEISVDVHSQNNVAPYTTGIDGSGDYVVYVQAGEQVCFDVQTVDTPTETVNITGTSGRPSGMTETQHGEFQESVTFCWTPGVNDFGEYNFDLNYEDNNQCSDSSATDQITVIVLCQFCPLNYAYENRTPTYNPLPPTTLAGEWITAGLQQPVNTGSNDVLFQANERIELGPYFTGGPGFVAEIAPTCFGDECDDCCDNWSGFTYDTPITAVVTPNNDGFNDVWYVEDQDNPQCAFNAMGFDLEIRTPSGSLVYKLEEFPGYCCPFRAPQTSGSGYSSIYWPGIYNVGGTPDGCYVNDGTYYYTLTFNSGCGNTAGESGYITVIGSPGSNNCSPVFKVSEEIVASSALYKADQTVNLLTQIGDVEPEAQSEILFSIGPNNNEVTATVVGNNEQLLLVELFSANGQLIDRKTDCAKFCALSIEEYGTGIYLLRAFSTNNQMNTLKFLKP